ncbi:MAG: hypothetical protein JNJ57_12565, partial [Saprospiraceae bacterium]|nr:hypothetical protein [Saprospiraceae bacterium]
MFSANTDIGSTYSADGGNTWTFGRSTYYPWGTVANPNWYRIVQRPDNQVLYAVLSEVNDIYLGYRIADWQIDGGGILVRSTDQGATWDTLYNFGHPVVWLEIDKNNPNRMFASVVHPTEGGLYRSDNAGVTWLEMAKPARAEGHPYNLVSLSDGGVVASFSARGVGSGDSLSESSGVFYSPSAGGAWIDRSGPAMRWYTKDLVLDPHDPSEQTWYATVWGRFTVWPGPNNAGNGGLYRTTDRGLNWTRIYAHETAESITIHPGNPNIAYLTVENDGLYYTENLTDPQPVFSRVTSFPFWRPKRVFFKPGHWSDVWVTTMGGGLWEGRTLSGTAAPEEKLNLKVWPNPIAAGGMLHVETRENQTLWLGLRDVSGKLIKTTDLHTPGQFSLEGIAPGVYWLEWRMGGVYVG